MKSIELKDRFLLLFFLFPFYTFFGHGGYDSVFMLKLGSRFMCLLMAGTFYLFHFKKAGILSPLTKSSNVSLLRVTSNFLPLTMTSGTLARTL